MAGLLVVSAIAFIAVRARMPSDLTSTVPHKGWRDDGAVVVAIRGGDTGLRPGDLVIAIDGRKLTDRVVPRASVGQRLRYTVRRGGRVIDVWDVGRDHRVRSRSPTDVTRRPLIQTPANRARGWLQRVRLDQRAAPKARRTPRGE